MQAVVETAPMLLLEGQIEGVADELRDRLRALDLTILSVESTDASPPRSEAPDDDPWSIHGKPVE
jgi:hypothetical protein